MNLGFGELLLIFIVILLIFGASKLPQLGDALGKGIKNFKRSVTGDDEIDVTPKKDSLPQNQTPAARAASSRRACTRTSLEIVRSAATSRRSGAVSSASAAEASAGGQ
ncbi:MAG: twin-arginine translocase TatA/TatE family subunit [Deltaproteobacteria bacterium]|nr:MAG: twin-arginine translocase TatA/TatE family subunit [Deltaproteobacteria bacterium]